MQAFTAVRCASLRPTFFPPRLRVRRSGTSRPTRATFVEQHIAKLDLLIEQLAVETDLNASTREIDDLLASLDPAKWHPEARREVFVNYLGFPFWDVLTFPMTRAREMGELNEILIDRISPQDARTLSGFDGVESLKGIAIRPFRRILVVRLSGKRLSPRAPACA